MLVKRILNLYLDVLTDPQVTVDRITGNINVYQVSLCNGGFSYLPFNDVECYTSPKYF